MVGTSNQSVPNMAIDSMVDFFHQETDDDPTKTTNIYFSGALHQTRCTQLQQTELLLQCQNGACVISVLSLPGVMYIYIYI